MYFSFRNDVVVCFCCQSCQKCHTRPFTPAFEVYVRFGSVPAIESIITGTAGVGHKRSTRQASKHLVKLHVSWQCFEMATDYELFYRENRHGLGEPTKEFVRFFDEYDQIRAKVLDVGCGQGRDALFIARLGHSVTAVDLSPSGISDLQNDATVEGLAIQTVVTDIRDYRTRRRFDVILIDRTLHILGAEERKAVLQKLLGLSKHGGYILIADERSNMPAFKAVLDASKWNWQTTLERRGFLFVRRD